MTCNFIIVEAICFVVLSSHAKLTEMQADRSNSGKLKLFEKFRYSNAIQYCLCYFYQIQYLLVTLNNFYPFVIKGLVFNVILFFLLFMKSLQFALCLISYCTVWSRMFFVNCIFNNCKLWCATFDIPVDSYNVYLVVCFIYYYFYCNALIYKWLVNVDRVKYSLNKRHLNWCFSVYRLWTNCLGRMWIRWLRPHLSLSLFINSYYMLTSYPVASASKQLPYAIHRR